MSEPIEWLTLEQLTERLGSFIPNGADKDQVIAGVILSLKSSEEKIRPLERGLLESGVVYAWHESDASVTKLALDVLGELGLSFFESNGLSNLGSALKELVCFLIQLHRHRVRVSNPVEVSVLLILHGEPSGLTATQILKKLAGANLGNPPPSRLDVDDALDRLAKATAASGPKPLVRRDQLTWKSLV